MATTLTDQQLIDQALTYLKAHKDATRGDLRTKLKTSLYRLEKLEKEGRITLPSKLSLSARASLGRKKNKVMTNWYINRPAPWQV